ncbi:addiction module protein [uncultured Nostoc sp.]|uniref:addiction module protein n=1 Tax=uncultured Nostoc sp. TaxID=340711 RepID=UPI0035CB06E6
MSETAEKLKLELSQLSAKKRAEIAYFLIHSLDEGIDDNLETAWDTELTQRLENINRSDKIKNKFILCLWQPNSVKPNPKLNW